MQTIRLLGSTAIGIVLGGVIFNAVPAYADVFAVADTVLQRIAADGNGFLSTISGAIQDVNKYTSGILNSIGNTANGTVTQLLQEGFTQEANYSKAQVGAQQQIADASNTAMARFDRDMRNAQIRDEQTPSATQCAALDGGVSTQAAAIQAFDVGATIAHIHDLRGEAITGMPSHFGAAQAVASMAQEHINNYCDADEAAANLCTQSTMPDADQQMLSLFGSGTYADQTSVNAAKDYATTLIEPIAPAALRGDQLTSVAGQDAAVRRRTYNARMSLASSIVDTAIGMQTPSVPLTAQQTQWLQNNGLTAPANGGWLQVLQIESERRFSDVGWNASLANMPPASVQREIASELALNNYLLFQTLRMTILHTTVSATHLAEDTDRNFMPTVTMPTPTLTN